MRSSTSRRRADRQVARQGRRVVPGEDVEARHGEGVGHGLARQRAAEDHPVAVRPRREDDERDHGDDPDQAEALRQRSARCTPNQAMTAQMSASQTASLRVRAAEADETPRARSAAGRSDAAPRGSRSDAGHEQARAEGERRERHRRVGQGRVEEQRQVDRRRQAGARARASRARLGGKPRSVATSAASRQASTGTSAPIEDAHTWAAGKVGPNSAIGIAARNVGSGSQTSKAGAGRPAAASRSSTARRSPGRDPRARLRATPT